MSGGRSSRRNQLGFGELGEVDVELRIGELRLEHVQVVAMVVGRDVQHAEVLPVLDPAAELLAHLAPCGLDRELAAPDGAAGEVPVATAVGVAHEQHVVVVRDHAFDADHLGPGDEPVHPQSDVGAADRGAPGLEREGHPSSVRSVTTGRVASDRLSWAKPRDRRAACACHEDLRSHPRRPRAQLADRRRLRANARAARDPDRRHAARQAQADLHAARGHGRLRDRRQRREDRGDGQQALRQALLPPLRVSRAG